MNITPKSAGQTSNDVRSELDVYEYQRNQQLAAQQQQHKYYSSRSHQQSNAIIENAIFNNMVEGGNHRNYVNIQDDNQQEINQEQQKHPHPHQQQEQDQLLQQSVLHY